MARPWLFVLACALLLTVTAGAWAAVPPGYRYIGSRAVSAGRVVLWYWNVDVVEPTTSRVAFAAHLFARAVDVDQERRYVALVRCDNRTYKGFDAPGPFEPIDPGEPIHAVWLAGCANGVAVGVAQRHARLDGGPLASVASPPPAPSALPAAPPMVPVTPPAATPPREAAPPATAAVPEDPRRADACVRFGETRATPAGDATITNTCGYAVEVALCYRVSAGAAAGRFDCGVPARGRQVDSLPPAASHVLPEYRRGTHRGIAAVACKGTAGAVLPRLDDGGRSGCF
jgi:hypothetical protein